MVTNDNNNNNNNNNNKSLVDAVGNSHAPDEGISQAGEGSCRAAQR